MKWEDYNRMNKKQKEEYNYRFKNHPIQINVQGIGFIFLMMYLSVIIMLFTSYIVITNDKFDEYKDSVGDILVSSSQFMITGIFVIILIFIFDVISIFGWYYKEKKWIRENNIVITHINILTKMFGSRR